MQPGAVESGGKEVFFSPKNEFFLWEKCFFSKNEFFNGKKVEEKNGKRYVFFFVQSYLGKGSKNNS